MFVAETPLEFPYTYVEFEITEQGWQLGGFGDCRPRTAEEGLSPVEFDVPSNDQPSPWDSSIQVQANEVACHGTELPSEEDLRVEVIYGREHVAVIMRVISAEGIFTCPGTPTFPYTLELVDPLGDRALVDASSYPPKVVVPRPD